MKLIKLDRFWGNEKQQFGSCSIFNEQHIPIFSSLSMERGWLQNKPDISCILPGVYPVVLEFSPSFNQMLWEVKNVPNRFEIKFHIANYWKQLMGCISLGMSLGDIDGDGYYDILESGKTLDLFHSAFGDDKEAVLLVSFVDFFDSKTESLIKLDSLINFKI